MLLFAGLGNPGAKHAGNRHNIGFMALDAIARRHDFSPWTKKFRAELAEGHLGGEKVLLVKPQTFMNLSGQAIGEAIRFYKLQPADLTVFYDEIDLAPGKVRIKRSGGHGGHNGIRSIDAHCGKDYRRVRLGVGHPGVKDMVHHHVLGDFTKADSQWLDPLLETLAEHAPLLVAGDESGFMNKLSLAVGKFTQQEGVAEPPLKGTPHVRAARPPEPAAKATAPGPMAAMLRRLLGRE